MKRNKLIASAVAAVFMLALTGCDLQIREKNKISVSEPVEIDTTTVTSFPFTVSSEYIGIDSTVGAFKNISGFNKDDGVAISFNLKQLSSDWSMIFQTTSGNIALTCLHYCEDGKWVANLWPSNYPSTESPATAYSVYKDSEDYIYVTISISQDKMVFYLDGDKMFTYADASGNFSKDTKFPTISNYCSKLLDSISETGFTCIHPSDTWANAGSDSYSMKNLKFTAAVDDDGAIELYNARNE